jgi:RNA polymerase sigma-B factor
MKAPAGRATACSGVPWIENPAGVAPADARTLSAMLLARMAELEEGTTEHQYVRNTLIEMNQSLVRFAARRFRHRPESEREDIVQSGLIGLIKAIDRFDLTRNVELSTFALPYIRGEIMRQLRDTTWAVHVPRRLQELRLELARAKERLEARHGREPSTAELAAEMNVPESEAVEAMAASNGYVTASLNTAADEHGASELEQRFGERGAGGSRMPASQDPAIELFENCHALAPLIAALNDREKRLLRLRFGQDRTQQQIGDELGYSQMHVSRLLTAIYRKLRAGLLGDE